MTKAFALAAFNTAVIATNVVHAAKRGVVSAATATKDGVATAASFTKGGAVAGATASKEAGVAFWAGLKYAHNYNKAKDEAAQRLTPEDIATSKPSRRSSKVRVVSK